MTFMTASAAVTRLTINDTTLRDGEQTAGVAFTDDEKQVKPMVMGCYGIGVSRTLQAVIEQANDADGLRCFATLADGLAAALRSAPS